MKKNIFLLSLFNFFLDFKPYAAIGIIYFAEKSGSYTLGMSVFAVTMLSAAVMEVPLGVFSDFVGRKLTINIGAFFSVLAVVLYAAGSHYVFFILGSASMGISRALFSGNNDAFLYDLLKKNKCEGEYHTYLGTTKSMYQFALGISAILGGIIAYFSIDLMMWISVIPQVLCFAVSLFFEPAAAAKKTDSVFTHVRESLKLFAGNKRLRELTIATVVSSSLGESGYQFQAAFFKSVWPLWAIGIAKTLGNFGAAFSFRFSGPLINRFGRIPIVISGKIVSRLLFLVALIRVSVLSPLLMSLTSLFYGVNNVCENSLLQEHFTDEQRATLASLASLFESIFFSLAFVVIGVLADVIGIVKGYIVIQILMLVPTWVFYRIYRIDAEVSS